MKVTAIAATTFLEFPESLRHTQIAKDDRMRGGVEDIDLLHEFAGRGCYKSWDKPNAATRTNEDYLGNIIDSEHYSVLEHGQVSFYVEGVSRSLLLELERHGRNSHLSFSVESQRYVDTTKAHPTCVIPPLYEDGMRVFYNTDGTDGGWAVDGVTALEEHYRNSLRLYDFHYKQARGAGVPVKQAREAARAFLPNATPVDFVVTADIRAWREVIEKRDIDGADKEIRKFAKKIHKALNDLAPNSMQEV